MGVGCESETKQNKTIELEGWKEKPKNGVDDFEAQLPWSLDSLSLASGGFTDNLLIARWFTPHALAVLLSVHAATYSLPTATVNRQSNQGGQTRNQTSNTC